MLVIKIHELNKELNRIGGFLLQHDFDVMLHLKELQKTLDEIFEVVESEST